MKTIAVDVDDVLCECGGAFIEYHNREYGTSMTKSALQYDGDYWWYWNKALEAEIGLNKEESERRYLEFLHSDYHVNRQKVIVDSRKALSELKKHYKLVVITARHFSIADKTREWILSEFNDIFNEIYFISTPDKKFTKADVCNMIGAEYLIDDAFDHCEIAAKQNITALLFGGYGWNSYQKLDENIVRIKNWEEILTFFENTMDK